MNDCLEWVGLKHLNFSFQDNVMARIDDVGWTKNNTWNTQLSLKQPSNAGSGGKAYAKNFRKTRKNIDAGNSPLRAMLDDHYQRICQWEPVERDQIESCKSAPVAVEARRKHGSETKALLQVLSKDQKDQPVFTVCSFPFRSCIEVFWKQKPSESKAKCYSLAHCPQSNGVE